MALRMPQAAFRLSVAAIGMAASAFALDEYMPLAPRVMEIDVGFERSSQLGYYDKSWEMVDKEMDKNPVSIPLQGKFGLSEGLEGSMSIHYIAEDVRGHAGFDRPVLALKYAHPQYKVGGYLAIMPPIGFEEIMNSGNYASMVFGALYGKNWTHCKLLTNAAYTFNTENEDETKEDQLHLFVKPEYPLPIPALAKSKQYLGVNVGFNYDFYFNTVVKSQTFSGKRHLFTLMPGLNYTFNRIISSELTLDLPVAGKGNGGVYQTTHSQAVRFQVYFTLDEAIYNTVGG
jgi:hypothetical protein